MRDFYWKYFTATGDIDAYLVLKEYENLIPVHDVEVDSQDDLSLEDARLIEMTD